MSSREDAVRRTERVRQAVLVALRIWVSAQVRHYGTQDKFAEAVGISQATISRWTRPVRPQFPSAETLAILATLTGSSVDEILGVRAVSSSQSPPDDATVRLLLAVVRTEGRRTIWRILGEEFGPVTVDVEAKIAEVSPSLPPIAPDQEAKGDRRAAHRTNRRRPKR